ncbi:MAG: hypothetical protein RIC81_12010 [Microcella pacifica]|uniref:hypothetical protein n=1 Tax=Microcella pacifica TaxID=2591847 RepID=UPI003314844E
MKKADPDGVIDTFQAATTAALDDWRLIDDALIPLGLHIRRRAASDAFLALAVSWEFFISTWVVAAVNRDTSKAIARLEGQMQDHALNELGLPASTLSSSLVTTSHLNLSAVRSVLDRRDWNIVIRYQKELDTVAGKWLAGPYEARAKAITAYQFAPALVVRVIRNALAHQSLGAIKEANEVVRKNSTPPALRYSGVRSLGVDGWGRYLLSSSVPTPRIAALHDELIALSERLRS